MKLDSNANDVGKYALINLRKLKLPLEKTAAGNAYFVPVEAVEWDNTPETEFFVIKLKDKYAEAALRAYASDAAQDDLEYAVDVIQLALRAGHHHPLCKKPD